MKNNRFFGLLGIARKAGKVQSGSYCAENALKTGKAFLIILSGDTSANTRKKFTDMCNYREIPILVTSDRESLGKAIGAEERCVAAVTDPGLAKALLSIPAPE